jgi:hypothetical protein
MTDRALPDQALSLGDSQLDPVSEVLRHLYWNVRELARQELRPRSRREHPAGDAWFHVVLEGAVDVTVDGETTRVEQGAFAFLMMDAAHAVVADGPARTVILSGRMTVEGGAALGGITGRMLVACRLLGEDPLVVAMLEAMESEFAAGRVGGASIVDRLANVVGARDRGHPPRPRVGVDGGEPGPGRASIPFLLCRSVRLCGRRTSRPLRRARAHAARDGVASPGPSVGHSDCREARLFVGRRVQPSLPPVCRPLAAGLASGGLIDGLRLADLVEASQ